MINIKNALIESLSALAPSRKLFHSEDDFKLALGMELAKRFEFRSDSKIRLEVPKSIEYRYYDYISNAISQETKPVYIDMWLELDGKKYGIELKYRTVNKNIEVEGEEFRLKNHSARDIGRYKFREDLYRLTKLKDKGDIENGYAIFLTNDPKFWLDQPNKINMDGAFRLGNDSMIKKTARWNLENGIFSKNYHNENGKLVSNKTNAENWIYGKEYTKDLKLISDYPAIWSDYSSLDNNIVLKYLLIEV